MIQQHTEHDQSTEQHTVPSIAAAHKQYMSCNVQLIVRIILTVGALVLSFIAYDMTQGIPVFGVVAFVGGVTASCSTIVWSFVGYHALQRSWLHLKTTLEQHVEANYEVGQVELTKSRDMLTSMDIGDAMEILEFRVFYPRNQTMKSLFFSYSTKHDLLLRSSEFTPIRHGSPVSRAVSSLTSSSQ